MDVGEAVDGLQFGVNENQIGHALGITAVQLRKAMAMEGDISWWHLPRGAQRVLAQRAAEQARRRLRLAEARNSESAHAQHTSRTTPTTSSSSPSRPL